MTNICSLFPSICSSPGTNEWWRAGHAVLRCAPPLGLSASGSAHGALFPALKPEQQLAQSRRRFPF